MALAKSPFTLANRYPKTSAQNDATAPISSVWSLSQKFGRVLDELWHVILDRDDRLKSERLKEFLENGGGRPAPTGGGAAVGDRSGLTRQPLGPDRAEMPGQACPGVTSWRRRSYFFHQRKSIF